MKELSKEYSKKHWELIELIRYVQQIAIFSRVSARHHEMPPGKAIISWVFYVSGETGEIKVSEHNGCSGETGELFSNYNLTTMLEFDNQTLPEFVLDFSLKAIRIVIQQYLGHAKTLLKMLKKHDHKFE